MDINIYKIEKIGYAKTYSRRTGIVIFFKYQRTHQRGIQTSVILGTLLQLIRL